MQILFLKETKKCYSYLSRDIFFQYSYFAVVDMVNDRRFVQLKHEREAHNEVRWWQVILLSTDHKATRRQVFARWCCFRNL